MSYINCPQCHAKVAERDGNTITIKRGWQVTQAKAPCLTTCPNQHCGCIVKIEADKGTRR
jgi:hypothetical protein